MHEFNIIQAQINFIDIKNIELLKYTGSIQLGSIQSITKDYKNRSNQSQNIKMFLEEIV